ncbi:hypothetical protein IGI04_021493 [Brassica rapa subsp. trilocularis]|uniref:Uncharacterized protein n=1 Tax=Brassica rapa subsp. trilocularis TaxID=1813537 RepID=A0ABQ7LY83_BRACM|nr:hypothetical protein IGI04_021493 [Brassica rapa subsp. trilocularis]
MRRLSRVVAFLELSIRTRRMSATATPMADFLTKSPYTPPPWASHLRPLPSHTFSLAHRPTPIHRWNLPNLPNGTELWIKVTTLISPPLIFFSFL